MWFALFLIPENLFTQGCESGHALVLIVHIITLEFRCPALTSLKLLQWASFISLECLFVMCLAFYFGLLVCWTAFAFILAFFPKVICHICMGVVTLIIDCPVSIGYFSFQH